MFILKKILNSSTTFADSVRVPTTPGTAYKLGSLLVLKDGAVTNCAATDMPDFVAGETLDADQKDNIICYPILPNMLFEAPAPSGVLNVDVGAKLVLALSSGFAVKLANNTDGGVATVFDLQNAKKSGDGILVRFIK
ncbi:MAG: hypothetical protein IJ488_06620 [Clostridia bacterium]|nr:hypothetical protein [Clostridia bacterium]